MGSIQLFASDIHIINFYTRCFNFPYEELVYELQHLFRTIESEIEDEETYPFVEQILNSVNLYQGEEQQSVRNDYTVLFVQTEDQKPLCPMVASHFLSRYARHYHADRFNALLIESGLHIASDEMGDSLINQLEYLSMLCEQVRLEEADLRALQDYLQQHILIWVPAFCDVLYQAASIAFYRDIAEGLKYYIEDLADRIR
jgi:TorA maturation chaperone TorD